MEILTPVVGRSGGPAHEYRHHRRWAFVCALATLVATWLSDTGVAVAEETLASESQIQAAFIVNFPKYVDWPASAFAGSNSPIVITVLGDTKVAGELQKVIGGRSVNGRELVLQHLASGATPGDCHILFISAAEQQRYPHLLAGLRDASMLTVGESDDFLELGGIINLPRRDKKIALEVNLSAAAQTGIRISSKLLNVATMVKGRVE